MADIILTNAIFIDYIFPFLLVFTIVFAILDKTKLLGEGKRQINAIISLVVALILIGFDFARDVIVKLIPFLAVALIILFVFMLLYGFAGGKKDGDVLHKGVKVAIFIIIALAVVVAVLWATGWWETIYETVIEGEYVGKIWMNVLIIAIIGGALAIVLSTGRKEKTT